VKLSVVVGSWSAASGDDHEEDRPRRQREWVLPDAGGATRPMETIWV
jgi:hypothetical protein